MKILKLLAGLLAAWLAIAGLWYWVSTPNPRPGDTVRTTEATIGCRTINPAGGEWSDCRRLPAGQIGRVESHPDGLGHSLSGRVRVRLAGGGVTWLPPGDLEIIK